MILTQSTKFICYALWKIIFKVSYLWNVLILRWKSFPILRIGINNLSDDKLLRRSHFFSDYARAVSLLFFFVFFCLQLICTLCQAKNMLNNTSLCGYLTISKD